MSIPNCYIIGVQKAGTTSLHDWLSQHPDVYGPAEFKDVDYFANPEKVELAKERFKKDFAGHKNENIILQSQVNYIFYPGAIVRIKELSPQAKLIIVFRDPAERAVSAYNYFKKMQREKRPIEEALFYYPKNHFEFSHDNSDFSYLEHGLYGKQLEYVFNYFSKNQVLVLQYDELKNNPENLVKKTFQFLGIDDSFVPEFRAKNITGKAKSTWLHNRLTKSSRTRRWLIKVFIDWWLPRSKRKILKQNLIDANTKNNTNEKQNNVHQELINRLKEFFKEDQQKLKKLLNENS